MSYMKTTLLGCTMLALSGAAWAQENTKIVYASYLNPLHITNPVLTEFFENVKEDSNGTIDYETSALGGAGFRVSLPAA